MVHRDHCIEARTDPVHGLVSPEDNVDVFPVLPVHEGDVLHEPCAAFEETGTPGPQR